MHKNLNEMKRYAIPLVKTFGSKALSNVRMNLLDSHTRMLFSIVAVAMMILAPSAMKGAKTTINFDPAGTAAYRAAGGDTSYETNFVMGDNYSPIGNGAKVGVTMNYRNHSSAWTNIDISRLAFLVNTAGTGNTVNEGAGFYLRRDADNSVKQSGLYAGNWNQKLAVLNLKPGDKVTFVYAGTGVSGDNANLHVENNTTDYVIENKNDAPTWMFQTTKGNEATAIVDFNVVGDLIVSANKGTMIKSITIDSNIAEYDITTTGNTTTFEFTKEGLLAENDFAIPFMSVSFGSATDYLVVQNNKQAHMYNSNGNEDLVTGGQNSQPSAGNFYAFKPTSSGRVTIWGGMQGDKIHLFVYNISGGYWEDTNGGDLFFKETYLQNQTHFHEIGFDVAKDRIYYICQDNLHESGNAFHLTKFSFTHTFKVEQLAKIVNLETDVVDGWIQLTKIEGAGMYNIHTKRCSGNITPLSSQEYKIQNNFLYMKVPTFAEGTDNGGTVVIDVKTQGGDVAFVATFPYHADYGYDETIGRSQGHIWNFIDPRNSDSNFGNCWIRNGDFEEFNKGTVSGILSIGQYKDTNSQFYHETQNREWSYSQRQTGMAGGFHDPYYANVFDMEGDNADMIWETEGLWFDTGTNLSCIYNEKDAYDQSKTNPLDFAVLGTDPDRYVGLMPVTDGKKSSFTIPGLKPGDRVLIFMKSGESSGDNGIFLNITGAKDALGKQIEATDLYKAGGTNWQHNRYEGCYHFIKDDTKDPNSEYGRMTFDMQAGSMCKLLYIHIYTGQRIVTTNIVSKNSEEGDDGRLLFINDKGAELGSAGSASQMSLRFRGKGQKSTSRVLTYSGSLNENSFTGDNFKISGTYNHLLDFKSKVGEMGMFRLRMNDVTYEYERTSNQKITYVADFCDRNFTVGYRDKVDSYPYTWDFTDIQGFSSEKMSDEADNYPIDAASQDEYGYEWDISLFDANGNMKVNTGYDPITNNLIFSPHKIGFGNQLWAGNGVIPETRGLWFYSENDSETGYTSEYSSSLYNDCLQITDEGIRFANVPDDARKRVAWWNYKMVVPDVPNDAAVYLRMKRDTSVPDDAVTYSERDNADVPFLAARFKFASQESKTDMVTGGEIKNGTNYSFFQVPGTTDEWIVAVKNTTGATNHLTFTLNGWIVKKVSVSKDKKTLGKYGWATESRERIIDPSLTAYLSGKNIETIIATGTDYANRTVTLERMNLNDGGDLMQATSGDGTIYACILHNADEEARISVLDGGFHLFVPDMHDYDVKTPANSQKKFTLADKSIMKAQLTASQVKWSDDEGDTKNFVLTATYQKVDKDDNLTDEAMNEATGEGFYRVGKNNPITSSGHQGYLPVSTEIAEGYAKFSIVFVDFEDNFQGTTTIPEVAPVNGQMNNENAEWFNLNGQKLNGKPNEGGVYIVNGKKVMVK